MIPNSIKIWNELAWFFHLNAPNPIFKTLYESHNSAVCYTTRDSHSKVNESFGINSSGYFFVKTDFSWEKKEEPL